MLLGLFLSFDILTFVVTYLKIFFLFVFSVLTIVFGWVPLSQRGLVLVTVVVSTVLLSFFERLSLKELGIRTDNIRKSLTPYLVFTLISGFGLVVLATVLGKTPVPEWWTYSHLQWAFLPISVVQEFAYRAYCQTKLQRLVKPAYAILITTLLYSGMHILWKDPLILVMTFFGGLGWGYLWYKYPNFFLLSVSHAILNFLAIYLNFFPWLVTEFFSLK